MEGNGALIDSNGLFMEGNGPFFRGSGRFMKGQGRFIERKIGFIKRQDGLARGRGASRSGSLSTVDGAGGVWNVHICAVVCFDGSPASVTRG